MFSDDEENDDVSGLAGWMYTDLLLGLMVIFLATITFIPEKIKIPEPVKPTPSASKRIGDSGNTKRNYEDINFIVELDNFDANIFKARLDDFKRNERIGISSKIIGAQLIGSYDSGSESTGVGISRALEYGRELEKAFPTLLKGVDASVETFISASPKVLVRLTYRKY